MKNKKILVGLLLVAVSYIGWGSVSVSAKSDSDTSSFRKIIVYQNGVSDAVRDQILGGLNVKMAKRFEHALKADVLENLTAAEILQLKSNPLVKRVDNDAVATIQVRENARFNDSRANSQAAQVIPWGIAKIKADQVWLSGNNADPIKVGVIDTGISLSHPDLAPNIKGGVNTIRPRRSANDDNGHGTHVAGIIAALNDGIGVVGVGPQIDLYAIKVLDASGSGWVSDIIEGIDWAISRQIQVTNMSFGTVSDVQSLHDAVIRANGAGIVQVAAAGNSGGSVIYPAAYPEVIAVSATDSGDLLASWSSRGPEVDLSAPGVSIYSTYKGTSYATLSGTSMASPHVAGSAALVLNTTPGLYDTNSNGHWDPAEVLQKLEDTSDDLGSTGFDNLYGFGRVNALRATQ